MEPQDVERFAANAASVDRIIKLATEMQGKPVSAIFLVVAVENEGMWYCGSGSLKEIVGLSIVGLKELAAAEEADELS